MKTLLILPILISLTILSHAHLGRGFDGWHGGFDASPETARHLIELGRKDARTAFREVGLVQ